MKASIKASLYDDLNKISLHLINAWKIEFKQEATNLTSPIYRWLDFRLRYIDPTPREVVYSNQFPINLPKTVANGLKTLVNKIVIGSDINSYQSKGLTKFTDFSSNQKGKRTDLLWADWGLFHLHITDIEPEADTFYSRRDCSDGESWLLFCIVNNKQVGLVDVRRHKDPYLFSDQELLRVIKQSWPNYIHQFKLEGLLAESNWTNEEIGKLRKVGMSNGITIGNEVYLSPGMGITNASTPLKVTWFADKIFDRIDELAELICMKDSPLKAEMRKLGIETPKFELRLTPIGVTLCESISNVAFKFTGDKRRDHQNYISGLGYLFCPSWAYKNFFTRKDIT